MHVYIYICMQDLGFKVSREKGCVSIYTYIDVQGLGLAGNKGVYTYILIYLLIDV